MDVDLQLLEVPRLLTAGSMYPFRTLARCVALSPPLRRQTGEFGGAVGDDTALYQNFVDSTFFEDGEVGAQLREAAGRQRTGRHEALNRASSTRRTICCHDAWHFDLKSLRLSNGTDT